MFAAGKRFILSYSIQGGMIVILSVINAEKKLRHTGVSKMPRRLGTSKILITMQKCCDETIEVLKQ